jgi:catechol 2,3-dioxygenase-like lactoylglutathione lyase family enzyme
MMDRGEMKSAGGADYGRSLVGFGINLLVRDVARTARFMQDVLGTETIRADQSFAIIAYAEQHFMLHQDATYAENPLLSLLPEAGARGAGIELRFYHTDPDEALERAREQADRHGCSILRGCSDRPHGLRECYILDENGYCFIPSRHLAD